MCHKLYYTIGTSTANKNDDKIYESMRLYFALSVKCLFRKNKK